MSKEKAFAMRKSGLSYGQINKNLNIPKSTLSGWFSGVDWSKNIKKSLTEINNKIVLVHIPVASYSLTKLRRGIRRGIRANFVAEVSAPPTSILYLRIHPRGKPSGYSPQEQ
jgi:hypothetical protein